VGLLRQNARLSNKQLAARVGLAESSTLARVRRLEERGVILGYHAEIASWALGVSLQALVAARLVRHSREVVERFAEHCRQLPQVVATYHIGGADDFLIHVGVTDSEALREFILTSISTRPEVTHIETHLIFDARRGAAAVGPERP
jgi:DNA-binding Lrp family transcriptional regulator